MKKLFTWGLFALIVTFTLTIMFFAWNVSMNPDIHISWYGQNIAPTTLTEQWAVAMLVGLTVTIVVALVFFVLAPLLLILSGLIVLACLVGLVFGLGGPILFILALTAVPLAIIGVPVWMVWFAVKKRPKRVIYESHKTS